MAAQTSCRPKAWFCLICVDHDLSWPRTLLLYLPGKASAKVCYFDTFKDRFAYSDVNQHPAALLLSKHVFDEHFLVNVQFLSKSRPIFITYYRKRGSASYIVREWLLWVVERERETPVTSSISRWNREWSCIWLPRQRVDPMHMHTRRRVLTLQLLSSARSAWQAKPQTATLATAQWPK